MGRSLAGGFSTSADGQSVRLRKLVLFIASLDAGGAERVLAILASAWARSGYQVTLVTLSAADRDFYALDANVERIGMDLQEDSMGLLAGLTANVRRVSAFRAILRRVSPDVIVSFGESSNIVALLASRGLAIRTLISERVDPSRHPIGRPWQLLRRWTYPWAERVVVQTGAVADWFSQVIPSARIATIPNPIAGAEQPGSPETPIKSHRRVLLAIGRLAHQKGFDLLLRSFAQLAPKHGDWDLVVFGEGDQRDALEAQAGELRLTGRVSFPGRVQNIGAQLATADLFVLSSRYEGFPNVLLEAMAASLPVVSFACPSGPAEIITPDQDGVLVPPGDTDALASTLDLLMASPETRQRMGAAAARNVARFELDAVLKQWEPLIEA